MTGDSTVPLHTGSPVRGRGRGPEIGILNARVGVALSVALPAGG
jgi:hypothetical protein